MAASNSSTCAARQITEGRCPAAKRALDAALVEHVLSEYAPFDDVMWF